MLCSENAKQTSSATLYTNRLKISNHSQYHASATLITLAVLAVEDSFS